MHLGCHVVALLIPCFKLKQEKLHLEWVLLVTNLGTPSYHLSLNGSSRREHIRSEMIRESWLIVANMSKQDDAI